MCLETHGMQDTQLLCDGIADGREVRFGSRTLDAAAEVARSKTAFWPVDHESVGCETAMGWL
jgi:hypothetical protein